MKIFLLIFTLFLGAQQALAADQPVPAPTPLPAPESRAVEVKFYGGLTGFDDGAYRVLKSAMASLLADGVLEQFKTTFWGREGGSTFCVELGHDPKLKIEQVTYILGSIQPRFNSFYEYTPLEKCP